jgi:hypothetical protein
MSDQAQQKPLDKRPQRPAKARARRNRNLAPDAAIGSLLTRNAGQTGATGLTPVARDVWSPVWWKSSLSFANGNCVEVADLPAGQVGVRHSVDTPGPVLHFTPSQWHAFLRGVRNGEFDSFS